MRALSNRDVSTILLLMHPSESEGCDLKITFDVKNFQAFFSKRNRGPNFQEKKKSYCEAVVVTKHTQKRFLRGSVI